MAPARVALITGASAGIGCAAALHFAERGWTVVACSRGPERVPAHPSVLARRMDPNDDRSVSECFASLRTEGLAPQVVINNAGHGLSKPFAAHDDHEIRGMFETNVFGAMRVIRAALPSLRPGAVIINVGSSAGLLAYRDLSAYCATKWALEGFTEALSYELPPGIRVKLVEPHGGIATGFFGSAGARGRHPPEAVAATLYRAATDGSRRLRYASGSRAELWLAVRLHAWCPALYRVLLSRRYRRSPAN